MTGGNDRANAFDLLRALAAIAVLYSHSFALYGLGEPIAWGGQKLGGCAVYVFFVLSGYLVAQSWDYDPHIGRFAMRRALRIFPALIVVLLLTTLVLGPLLTTWPVSQYLGSGTTWLYILNNASLLWGSNNLPGMFESNPLPFQVNGSLWTLGYEVTMYATLVLVGSAVGRFGNVARRWALLCLAGSLLAFGLYALFFKPPGWGTSLPGLWRLGLTLGPVRLAELGVYFFAGACCYEFRDRLRLSLLGCAAGLGLLLLTAAWPRFQASLAWVIVPYIVIGLAWKLPAALRRSWPFDYSYGIYVYAFPVQQMLSMWGQRYGWSWGTVAGLSLAVTLFFSMLSWHFLEHPTLRFKPRRPRPLPRTATGELTELAEAA